MKLQTQRFIDRWVGQLLCSAVSAWVRFTGLFGAPAQLGKAPRNILIILLSEMGSIVLAGPMFAALRQRYPSATVHVLQLKKNQEVAKLLGLAQPEHLHALDDSAGLGLLGDIWRVCMTLRRLPQLLKSTGPLTSKAGLRTTSARLENRAISSPA